MRVQTKHIPQVYILTGSISVPLRILSVPPSSVPLLSVLKLSVPALSLTPLSYSAYRSYIFRTQNYRNDTNSIIPSHLREKDIGNTIFYKSRNDKLTILKLFWFSRCFGNRRTFLFIVLLRPPWPRRIPSAVHASAGPSRSRTVLWPFLFTRRGN